jgi:7-cyano-7-deazaguanine synthase in queuosine biosynthesis
VSNPRLVLWSGGCDSTLALYEALSSQKIWAVKQRNVKEIEQRPDVCALSIVHHAIDCQGEQRRAREALKKEFKRRGLVCNYYDLEVRGTFTPSTGSGGGSPQGRLWLSVATPYLWGDDQDLVLGWHKGELDRIAEFRALFDALQRLGGKTGRLEFPLAHYDRRWILYALKEYGLLDLCWYCEYRGEGSHNKPPRKLLKAPCGTCEKCMDFEAARWSIKEQQLLLKSNGILPRP